MSLKRGVPASGFAGPASETQHFLRFSPTLRPPACCAGGDAGGAGWGFFTFFAMSGPPNMNAKSRAGPVLWVFHKHRRLRVGGETVEPLHTL